MSEELEELNRLFKTHLESKDKKPKKVKVEEEQKDTIVLEAVEHKKSEHLIEIPDFDKEHNDSTPAAEVKKDLETVAEFSRPGNWCINESSTYSSGYKELVLRYPKITITNSSSKRTHTIYDLYFRILLNSSYRCVGGFQINRGKRSNIEAHHGYLHSHAGRIERSRTDCYSTICTGGDSQTISKFRDRPQTSGKMLKWWFDCIEAVNQYLLVESEEGGPHIRIQTLVKPGIGNNYDTSNNRSQIYNKFVVSGYKPLLTSTSGTDRHTFAVDRRHLEAALTKWLIEQEYQKIENRVLVNVLRQGSTEYYFEDGSNSGLHSAEYLNNRAKSRTSEIKWNDNFVVPEFFDVDQQEKYEQRVNPTITDFVISRLNPYINKFYIQLYESGRIQGTNEKA